MGSCISENVTAIDFFAKPVTMTFRGTDSYKSFAGGCVTIILVMMLLMGSITTFL